MTKVEKLANEIQQLDRQELAAFREWFRKYDSDDWDKEIEQDVLAGRLDDLANEAVQNKGSELRVQSSTRNSEPETRN